MAPLAKSLIFLGAVLLLAGAALHVLPRLPYVGRLPGDILIKRGDFTFYFPLTTCLLLSLGLTLLFRFFGKP